METFKMPFRNRAFNPLRLPLPSPEFDFVKTLKAKGKLKGFETVVDSRVEDLFRVKALVGLGGNHAILSNQLKKATDTEHLPLSPASHFYMRENRLRLVGAVHEYFHERGFPDSEIFAFTLIHQKWFVAGGSLSMQSAAKIKAKLLRYLERAGVTAADGLLFAGLHASFDDTGYQLHFHGIVAGDKVRALRKLLGKFGFVSTERIYRPLKIGKLVNPARQISYCLQSWWPHEPAEVPFGGKRRRLPPNAHAEFLMWMANQNLLELVVMSGMRIGKNGIESTRSPNS